MSKKISFKEKIKLRQEKNELFKEKNKLFTMRHKKKATPHAILALIILLIPFLTHQLFFKSDVPTDTRPDDVNYRMSFVGDMMLGRHVHDAAVWSGESIDRVFDYVAPFLHESDYATGNFESPILNVADKEVKAVMEERELHNKDIHLYSEPWAVDALVQAGFDSVTIANNHALDYGDLSLEQTLAHFADAPIDTLGVGHATNLSEKDLTEGAKDATEMTYFDVGDDVRAGIIGITDVFVKGFSAQDYVGGVFTTEYQGLGELRSRIIDAKNTEAAGGGGADFVIVHIHWGAEYQTGSNERQEELAQYLANTGADIIIGHHSHVLEPVTIVEGSSGNNTLVLNGMGNFVFDQGWTRTKESTIAQLDFLEDGSKQLSFVPIFINDSKPRETEGILKSYRNYRIFRTLRKELDSNLWTVENDRLMIDLDAAGVLEGVQVAR